MLMFPNRLTMACNIFSTDRAAFFDFDGVIADSEPLHHRAYCILLDPAGLEFSWNAYRTDYIGFDDRDVLKLVHRRAGRDLPPDDLARLVSRKADIFEQLSRENPPALYPGVRELLEGLKPRMRLALCTGALLSDIRPILAGAGLDGMFDVIVTADDVRAGKPDPDGYRQARCRLGRIQSAGTESAGPIGVAVEDTPAGIAAARGAGLRVIAVTTTHAPAALRAADRIVASLADVRPEDVERLAGP